MIRQILVVLLIVGAVFCHDEAASGSQLTNAEAEQKQQQQQQDGGSGLGEFGNHMIDVALIAEKNAKRAYNEAKPTLGAIKNSIKGRLSALINSPQIKKITSDPRAQQLVENVQKVTKKYSENPQRILEETRQTVDGFVEKVNERRQLLEKKIRSEHEQRQEALRKSQQGGDSSEE